MTEQNGVGPNSLSSGVRLTVVALVIVIALAAVYLPGVYREYFGKEQITSFAVTAKPLEAYQLAMKGDQPIFLEFYAKW